MDMTRIKCTRLFCGHYYIHVAKRQSIIGHSLDLARAETKKAGRGTLRT
jgi:hypothetical protein